MADDTGGLDTAEQQQMIKATQPKTGGLNLGNAKGVSLDPTQSTEVRNRLLEMIKQREAERSGWGRFFEGLALPLAPEAELGTRIAEHNKRNRDRDQDIFNMQLGVSQLDTETARLAQAKAKALQDKNQFSAMLTGGANNPATGQEGGGQVATPQQVQSFAKGLSQTQATALMMLYDQNPTEATKQMLMLTKKTDVEREAEAAGLVPGSEEYQTFMRVKLAGPSAFNPQDVRTPEGTVERTPLQAARPGGALPTTSAPAPGSAQAPAPAPAASTTQGPLTTTVTPRVVLPEPTPAPVRRQGALSTTAPVATTTGFAPGSKEDLAARQEQEKARIAVEQKRQEVPIAGDTEQAKKMGEADAAEQVIHSDNVKLAPSNAIVSKQLETDIKAIPGLLGKLSKPTIFSTIINIADKGIQVGNLGSISIPGLKDAIVQLDPEARKDPKKLEAYQRVINNISKIGLEFARAVNKGMGSMSNYERSIVEQAVGDPNKLSPNNLMIKAKALECDAKNAMEKDKLWKQMKNAKYSWSQFKSSPEYKDMERKQFYRTANAMRVPDAKFPGDQ